MCLLQQYKQIHIFATLGTHVLVCGSCKSVVNHREAALYTASSAEKETLNE